MHVLGRKKGEIEGRQLLEKADHYRARRTQFSRNTHTDKHEYKAME